jgi:glutamine synthetase
LDLKGAEMNPHEALEFVKKNKIQIVSLKFMDLLGTWQHSSIPVEALTGTCI